MKSYLTFIRKFNNDCHMIGIKNPENVKVLSQLNLFSGQPIICVLKNTSISSVYAIKSNSNIDQIFGEIDDLFEEDTLKDITLINLPKYNTIKYYLTKIYEKLSFKEIYQNHLLLCNLENDIYYSILHVEIDVLKIKSYILKTIRNSEISIEIKNKLINNIRNLNPPTKNILNKKVDLNLSGYKIYIDTKIH